MNTNSHDFSTVSPSAKTLLMMKGYTTIPFAREAATLISAPEKYEPRPEEKDLVFWIRTSHFESRYQSVNQLMQEIDSKNVLELSSGFSFRGLALTQHQNVHYIDTDLPELIEQKKEMTKQLLAGLSTNSGQLETLPLNALNEAEFEQIVARFDQGPLTIVNEGLLMYLNIREKEQLCRIIHKILKERGGYWITADIYRKDLPGEMKVRIDDKLQQFLDAHNVEENKFDSFEAAEAFFKHAGFVVDKEAEPDYQSMSSFPYLLKNIPPEHRDKMKQMSKIQATWRLKVADREDQ